MATKKTPPSAMQWKVIRGMQSNDLERTLEEWTGKGWTAFTILGPLSGGFVIVLHRMLTL